MKEKFQKTEWGYVNWVHMADETDSRSAMSVGLITMYPHTRAKRHIHYGQEQMIYVLSGKGVYYINDVEYPFSAGDYFVMEADCSHETINDSDDNIAELLVSVPVGKKKVSGGHSDDTFDFFVDENENILLYRAAADLTESVRKMSDLPFTVFDVNGRAVMQSASYPEACMRCCDPINDPSGCECLSKQAGECDAEDSWISCTCSHGLTTFICPISYEGKLAGIARGGHFFTSEKGVKSDFHEYDVPMTAQIAMHSVLDQIVETIENYIRYLASVDTLHRKDRELLDQTMTNESLQKDLGEVSEQITNLKINHHFLFNTLNCMSAMALEGDRYDLYKSIIDLSKMFRYTMTAELKMVQLSSEIEYLKAYLNLQKLRYKDGLAISYEIDDSCLDTMIPFNFLQPIIENAFTHGFMSYDYDKEIDIMIRNDNGEIVIDMTNNGVAPAAADISRIENDFRSKNGHGLGLIYEKLEKCYGSDFDMTINVQDGEKTRFTVRIPR